MATHIYIYAKVINSYDEVCLVIVFLNLYVAADLFMWNKLKCSGSAKLNSNKKIKIKLNINKNKLNKYIKSKGIKNKIKYN